ncbi:MAG: response regulator, partial [Epsilonproteobacteria bacterium]|nr:response regulator [Campylobacterota bacterium]
VLYIENQVFSIEKESNDKSLIVISKYAFALYAVYKFLSNTNPPKVLIADDDAISIKLIETILEGEFCEVESVLNGKDALDKILNGYIQGEPYDYIYIDNKMPIINGSDVMRHIREYELDNGIERGVYAISTTGEVLDEFTNQLYDLYIGKPFKKEDVISALQRR